MLSYSIHSSNTLSLGSGKPNGSIRVRFRVRCSSSYVESQWLFPFIRFHAAHRQPAARLHKLTHHPLAIGEQRLCIIGSCLGSFLCYPISQYQVPIISHLTSDPGTGRGERRQWTKWETEIWAYFNLSWVYLLAFTLFGSDYPSLFEACSLGIYVSKWWTIRKWTRAVIYNLFCNFRLTYLHLLDHHSSIGMITIGTLA